ncbi:MobV family relaxase [Pseudoalteromonas sp. SA25]|uniref:MobV family relaxase n=1 Tax=Pseudoalteromonas sp. SA25 TaxID=2686347 RepID=UPI0013FD4C27|nr:MobV family relaxase [Pseudoalteromonas sp. SA25]
MNPETPRTVLRALKYDGWGPLQGLQDHLSRANNPPNVDPSKTHLNRVLVGSYNICNDAKRLLKDKGIVKLRKNGVLAIEFVLSFSQSYIRNSDGSYKKDANQRYRDWVNSTKDWLLDEFGKNCIFMGTNLDEICPHIHTVIIPVSERTNKSGKKVVGLNARGITGGKEKLAGLQDRYAAAVAHLGIQRGRKGSKAKRTTLKQYYQALNESKALCNRTGLIPPNTHPESFNSWQAVVGKLADSIESRRESEINKLKDMIKELVETNTRLRQELVGNRQRVRYTR